MDFFIWAFFYFVLGVCHGVLPFCFLAPIFLSPLEEKRLLEDLVVRLFFGFGIFSIMMPGFIEQDKKIMTDCITFSQVNYLSDFDFTKFNVCEVEEYYEQKCLAWEYVEYEYEDRTGMHSYSDAFCLEYEDEGRWIKHWMTEEEKQDQVLSALENRSRLISFWICVGALVTIRKIKT